MCPIEELLIIITVILLLFVQLNLQQFVVFHMMYERWADECLTVLTVAMIKGTIRLQQRIARSHFPA